MPSFEIICLANSAKYGGRCIAGLKTDGSGWLRPVSTKSNGTLYPEHYLLEDDREPQLFDILQIECTHPCPEPHQPENWAIANRKWKLVGRPNRRDRQKIIDILSAEVGRTRTFSQVFGNPFDRIESDDLQRISNPYSLALVKPEFIAWQVQRSLEKKRVKAIFTLNQTQYSFAITDPVWRTRLSTFPEGVHSVNCDRYRLTVSLGEPFVDGFCYKLVAAVIDVKQLISQLESTHSSCLATLGEVSR